MEQVIISNKEIDDTVKIIDIILQDGSHPCSLYWIGMEPSEGRPSTIPIHQPCITQGVGAWRLSYNGHVWHNKSEIGNKIPIKMPFIIPIPGFIYDGGTYYYYYFNNKSPIEYNPEFSIDENAKSMQINLAVFDRTYSFGVNVEMSASFYGHETPQDGNGRVVINYSIDNIEE